MDSKNKNLMQGGKLYQKACLETWGALPFYLTAVKPWPNGLASRRKFKIWVYLRLRLARP